MGAFRGKYKSIETAKCISINKLVKNTKESILKNPTYKEFSIEEIYKITLDRLNSITIEGQNFQFESVPNRLGGYRWFVKCPDCGKKVLKLYTTKDKNQYLCKECQNLKSPSSLYGSTTRYKEVIKPMLKMEKIKEKLKTSKISERKTNDLLDEYDRLNNKWKSSTLYRKTLILRQQSL